MTTSVAGHTDLPARVLTVQQPWAWAIIHGGKDVENRDWKPARPLVLLIHAGLKTDFAAFGFMQQLGVEPPVTSVLAYGAIIGAVTVTGWTETSPSRWASHTRWHWLLSNPGAAQQPIPYRGQTGLFRPPEDWRDRFQAAWPPQDRSEAPSRTPVVDIPVDAAASGSAR